MLYSNWMYKLQQMAWWENTRKMKKIRPKVSVLMPVYNAESYLHEAIGSILKQTFTNFEFLIINDGSTDQSQNIIDSYQDPRIKKMYNRHNSGIVRTLNKGLDFALGEYIARMDADDVSLPERLEKQVALMETNSEIGVCGAWIQYLNNNYILNLPTSDEEIKVSLTNQNPMAHPTVVLRTSLLRQHRIYYDPAFCHVEDYELWIRLAKITRFTNVPEVLLYYRIHPSQIGNLKAEEQQEKVRIIQQALRSG